MRKRFFCAVIFAIVTACGMSSAAGAAEAADLQAGEAQKVALSPEDAEFLVRSVAAEYVEMPYAARVGIIAVILNRVAAEGYPDTAAGVISTYRNADGSPRFAERALADAEAADPRSWRMTRDAYSAVTHGADVTQGALNFEPIERISRRLDLDFDDRGEDEHARALAALCAKYKLVVGGVGFW